MKYRTLDDALACPVIGSYAKRVAAVDAISVIREPSWLFKHTPLLGTIPETMFDITTCFRWRVPVAALQCLCANPDSAHMLDLSSDELLAMYKCGSHMAGVYAAIRLAEEQHP